MILTVSSAQEPRASHLPALDGVRGLAILLVLLHHCYLQPHPASPLLEALYQLSRAAWVGVDLFFVLSGFLITGILFDSRSRAGYFSTFYKRRVLRIFPLYFGAIGLALACTYPLHLAWHGRQWLLLGYLQNVGLRSPFDYQISPIVSFNHFWSLAVEEQYYLVWPLIVFLLRGGRKLIVLSLLLAATALGLRLALSAHVNAEYLFTATPMRADALLIGGALALAMRAFSGARVSRTVRWLCPIALAGIIAMGIAEGGFFWPQRSVATYGMTLTALCAAGLIAFCLRAGTFAESMFSRPLLRFFGRYSYGLYVWHVVVFSTLKPLLLAHLELGLTAALLANTVCISASVVVALGSYRWLEQPFLRLKERIAKKPSRTRELAPV